jgi:AraC-like DNA-binding protein
VNELIQKIGLQRAAQLISQRWRLVSPVAYEVGISKIFYFIKVFKEEYGVLLSEFV